MTVYTRLTGRLPAAADDDLAPGLLFLKWHGYDRFVAGEGAFDRERQGRAFLVEVKARVETVGRLHYPRWHQRFADAADAVGARRLATLPTQWRLICGWATNPGLEVGLELHPMLGFPYVPGSAVRGLVRRVAEEEVLAAVPEIPEEALPERPSGELEEAVRLAGRVRALLGSLTGERASTGAPESLPERLAGWRDRILREWPVFRSAPAPWQALDLRLERLLADAAVGGLMAWLDAVPARMSFAGHQVLDVDMLTPHHRKYYEQVAAWERNGEHPPGNPVDSEGPNIVAFLAVRPGVKLEFRARRTATAWPTAEEMRRAEEVFGTDDEDLQAGRERARLLAGWGEDQAWTAAERWLLRGLEEVGLGGKTSAGYGYFGVAPGPEPTPVERAREEAGADGGTGGVEADPLSDEERWAREWVPEGLDKAALGNLFVRLQAARATEAQRRAAAQRIVALYGDVIDQWRGKQNRANLLRLRWLDENTGDGS